MIRKQISAHFETVSCDVCGRSLLRGEHADTFIVGGERRQVCDLCTVRAARVGWIREGLEDAQDSADSGRKRGSFMARWRASRAERETLAPDPEPAPHGNIERIARESDQPGDEEEYELALPDDEIADVDGEPAAPTGEETVEPEPHHEPVLDHHQATRTEREPSPPGEALYEQRSVRGVPSNTDLKLGRALELFNQSPHVRTVSGVSRTLGAPLVCAQPSRTEGSVVTIVVGWELSWYRYEVDLGDEGAGVRVVGQGDDLGELDESERVPNATADDNGLLHQAATVS